MWASQWPSKRQYSRDTVANHSFNAYCPGKIISEHCGNLILLCKVSDVTQYNLRPVLEKIVVSKVWKNARAIRLWYIDIWRHCIFNTFWWHVQGVYWWCNMISVLLFCCLLLLHSMHIAYRVVQVAKFSPSFRINAVPDGLFWHERYLRGTCTGTKVYLHLTTSLIKNSIKPKPSNAKVFAQGKGQSVMWIRQGW